MHDDLVPCRLEDRAVWPKEQVAEVALLLPQPQAAELERLAHSRGLTMGELLRLLIREYLTQPGWTGPG
jgi:hypothetical protein